MKKLLVSIHDSKAESWSTITLMENKATAMRDFGSLVADGRTVIGMHPADFDLFVVGGFDTSTGLVEAKTPEHLANGLDFAKSSKE